MSGTVLDLFQDTTNDTKLATQIANLYTTFKNAINGKTRAWEELRNYLFATDTTTTTNAQLPWKNKTTRPKLTQIRDNLQANYMAALFPNDKWFKWIPDTPDSAKKKKARAIEAYMQAKFRESNFKHEVSKLVNDFIDYGNAFGDVAFEKTIATMGNVNVPIYIGPKVIRISPLDIVFDITAPSFMSSPKITRTLLSFGQIEKLRRTDPAWAKIGQEVIDRIKKNRQEAAGNPRMFESGDHAKLKALVADGFSTILQYYNSGMVEFLEFEGDYYDTENMKLYENHVITVVDRLYIVRKEPISNWFGTSYKKHIGWRLRPDNLIAMGPLDNLVGLQYRLDHLENLRADVFDLIAFPPLKVKGYVEDFKWGPNERIYMEQDSDVESLAPETIALNADMQIAQIEQTMEDMAGAPKQAMGIRTPGEKTAFEVSELMNAASRTFQMKAAQFEEMLLEPLINEMLEIARRNFDAAEIVRVINDQTGVSEFLTITPDDIKARGKLVPMGARHFAAQAQLVQNLSNLAATQIYMDPSVSVHISGLRMAQLLEENLNLERFQLVSPNVRVFENADTQALMAHAQTQIQSEAVTPTQTMDDVQNMEEPQGAMKNA